VATTIFGTWTLARLIETATVFFVGFSGTGKARKTSQTLPECQQPSPRPSPPSSAVLLLRMRSVRDVAMNGACAAEDGGEGNFPGVALTQGGARRLAALGYSVSGFQPSPSGERLRTENIVGATGELDMPPRWGFSLFFGRLL